MVGKAGREADAEAHTEIKGNSKSHHAFRHTTKTRQTPRNEIKAWHRRAESTAYCTWLPSKAAFVSALQENAKHKWILIHFLGGLSSRNILKTGMHNLSNG